LTGIVDRIARWQIAGLDAWSIADDRSGMTPDVADAVVERIAELVDQGRLTDG
jgi:hypothetical protein